MNLLGFCGLWFFFSFQFSDIGSSANVHMILLDFSVNDYLLLELEKNPCHCLGLINISVFDPFRRISVKDSTWVKWAVFWHTFLVMSLDHYGICVSSFSFLKVWRGGNGTVFFARLGIVLYWPSRWEDRGGRFLVYSVGAIYNL